MKKEIRTIQLPEINLPKKIKENEENKVPRTDLTMQEENIFSHIYNLEPDQETHLTPRQTKRINVLKEKYKDVETLGPQDIGNFTLVQHEIHLTDQVPTIAKYSTKSPEVNEWIEE